MSRSVNFPVAILTAVVFLLPLTGTSSGQTKTAAAMASCRSLAMDPYSGDVEGVGTVHNHVSTFDGKRGLPLFQRRPDQSVFFSRELRPRAGTPGIYEADYITFDVDGNGLDYGSFTVSLPTADSDANDLPDFVQQSREANTAVSGNAKSDAFGTVWNIAGSLWRSSGSNAARYSVALSSSGPTPLDEPVTYTGTATVSLVNASGIISYSRTANSATFNLTLAGQGATRTLTGSTSFAVTSPDQVAFSGFNVTSPDGVSYAIKPFSLRRAGQRYAGNLQLVDGNPETDWADYVDWVLEVFDSNDFDGNGIPDLSDAPQPPATAQLSNVSTRLRVETGDGAMIGGFIIAGHAAKRVVVRAIGPSLQQTGVSDALTDPVLELHGPGGALITSNDNWKDTQRAEVEGSNLAPQSDLESAIVATLEPGLYTAVVSGKNGGTGVALVEVYALGEAALARFANISTRGLVATGDGVMIGGVIVTGSGAQKVIIRAVGPSLEIDGKLLNPFLELYDGNGALVQSNDNWRSDQEAEILATTIAPSNDAESAIVRNLSPAPYTAIVSGVNETTGVALVEVYALD